MLDFTLTGRPRRRGARVLATLTVFGTVAMGAAQAPAGDQQTWRQVYCPPPVNCPPVDCPPAHSAPGTLHPSPAQPAQPGSTAPAPAVDPSQPQQPGQTDPGMPPATQPGAMQPPTAPAGNQGGLFPPAAPGQAAAPAGGADQGATPTLASRGVNSIGDFFGFGSFQFTVPQNVFRISPSFSPPSSPPSFSSPPSSSSFSIAPSSSATIGFNDNAPEGGFSSLPPATQQFLTSPPPTDGSAPPPGSGPGAPPPPPGALPPGIVRVDEVGQTVANVQVTRTYKAVQNQSPLPTDRVYSYFNYYDSIDDLGSSAYFYNIGFEKTFLDGNASIQLNLPYQTVNAGDQGPFRDGEDIGNLSVILKGLLFADEGSRMAISSGVAVNTPTGGDVLGGSKVFFDTGIDNNGSIQPFISAAKFLGDTVFVQGYSGIDTPFDSDDITIWYNTATVGLFLPTGNDTISAIVPKVEVHSNSPLGDDTITLRPSDGYFFQPFNVEASTIVNLTYGATVLIKDNQALTVAGAVPISGPEVFESEVQVQYSLFAR